MLQLDRNKQSIEEIHRITELACEIIHNTNDGNDLEPRDMKLTEMAVNGHLNDKGIKALEQLHQQVKQGTYQMPWLCGVEPFTMDQIGNVYYKKARVEHFETPYCHSAFAKNYLLQLKDQFEFLERKGIEPPSTFSPLRDHTREYVNEKLEHLNGLFDPQSQSLEYSEVRVYCAGHEYSYLTLGRAENLQEIKDHPVTQDIIGDYGYYEGDEYIVNINSYAYGSGNEPVNVYTANREALETALNLCHRHMQENSLSTPINVRKIKTDFSQGMDAVLRLDELLGSQSVQFTEVDVSDPNNSMYSFEVLGKPDLQELLAKTELADLSEYRLDKIKIFTKEYTYGEGPPITADHPGSEEIQNIIQNNFDYLEKYNNLRPSRVQFYDTQEILTQGAEQTNLSESTKALLKLMQNYPGQSLKLSSVYLSSYDENVQSKEFFVTGHPTEKDLVLNPPPELAAYVCQTDNFGLFCTYYHFGAGKELTLETPGDIETALQGFDSSVKELPELVKWYEGFHIQNYMPTAIRIQTQENLNPEGPKMDM